MYKLIFSVLLTSIVAVNSSDACIPQDNVLTDNIKKAIASGNAKEFSAYFDTSLKLTVKEKEGIYSKNQAEQIIKIFMEQNPPVKFEIKHSAEQKGSSSSYIIGSLSTQKGPYRVTIRLKKQGDICLIHSLIIEEDNAWQ